MSEAGQPEPRDSAVDTVQGDQPLAIEEISATEMQAEILRLRANLREQRVEVGQLEMNIRGSRMQLQQQASQLQQLAALLRQTTASAAAYRAELDELKFSAGWIIFIVARQFERRFPVLASMARRPLRLAFRTMRFIWRTARLIRSRLLGQAKESIAIGAGSQLLADSFLLDPGRETILLVVHDASRTGAPILAYSIARRLGREKNVVVLLLGGGELIEDFRGCCAAMVGPMGEGPLSPDGVNDLVRRLVRAYPIAYAIVNTIASRAVLEPLALANVPTVALVHEFGSYMMVHEGMGVALEWATQIVFSAEITAAAARQDDPNLENRPLHILRQGRPDLPARDTAELGAEAHLIRKAMRPVENTRDFVVLGIGTIHIRKGVDLFLSCASAVAALQPERPVRFAWIGNSVDPMYHSFLYEQVTRAGIGDMVAFIDEVADLDPAYELADLFLMSSRLDPQPNVAIEAMLRGLPVVCFDKATGIAEVLGEDPATRSGVAPHLDVAAAARLIADLADDTEAYARMSEATRRVAERTFDMDEYVRQLDTLGHEAMAMIHQREADVATIAADPLFDLDLAAGPDLVRSRDQAIRVFVARSAALGNGQHPVANCRRPCPGFHPQIYEHENREHYARSRVNALAHFIRSGEPEGPWKHAVITPDDPAGGAGRLRVAVHGHFYYPELADEFMRRWAANLSPADLFLSTDSEDKAALLRRATQGYGRGEVTIRVAPNCGRDVGPLLTLFGAETFAPYDIVGHVHGKRSLVFEDRGIGETWRDFLWENLLGKRYPMADIILARFRDDPRLGLVFPEDPHLCDWDNNLGIANDLARRMGITLPLPMFFDFPVGTMFWARTSALKPLLDLGLGWSDYPEEPVPFDGTVLHATERLLPFVADHAGYHYATTHIEGVTR